MKQYSLVQKHSPCKNKLMKLILPDTYERMPVLQRNATHHKNLHAKLSLLLMLHIKQLQFSVAMKCASKSQQTSDFAAVLNHNAEGPATTEGIKPGTVENQIRNVARNTI